MCPVSAGSVKTGHGTAAFSFWKNYATELWQIISDPGHAGSYLHTDTTMHCWVTFLCMLLNPDCSALECHLLVTLNAIFLSQAWEGPIILNFFNKQLQNTTHSRLTLLESILNKNFHWTSSCGMSQIAQTSLCRSKQMLLGRMAKDGWKSNISSFTVKNHLAQKCQPKSI